jgi:hypothetical protein
MIQRPQQPAWSSEPPALLDALPQTLDGPPDQTIPRVPPPRVDAADEDTILGFPAEVGADADGDGTAGWTDPPASESGAAFATPVQLVTLRRGDPVAGGALVLAGVAAFVSLWLPWQKGTADTGLSLLWEGLRTAGSGMGALDRSGLWQPLAIVLGGGFLFLLGVLLFLPERTHRFVGVLSLLVAMGAAAGVLFSVAQAQWSAARFDLGMWCAVAVGAFGVLGALKAMLTAPRVTMRPRRTAPG